MDGVRLWPLRSSPLDGASHRGGPGDVSMWLPLRLRPRPFLKWPLKHADDDIRWWECWSFMIIYDHLWSFDDKPYDKPVNLGVPHSFHSSDNVEEVMKYELVFHDLLSELLQWLSNHHCKVDGVSKGKCYHSSCTTWTPVRRPWWKRPADRNGLASFQKWLRLRGFLPVQGRNAPASSCQSRTFAGLVHFGTRF